MSHPIIAIITLLVAGVALPLQATENATSSATTTATTAIDSLENARNAVLPAQSTEAHHFNSPRVWIVSVGSSVYSDFDNDGFFTHFNLPFDADVDYGDEWVFASILLRTGEADYELFHTSDIFEIHDSSSFDKYRLESELVRNYPTGYYDVRIELRQAYNDSLLDVVDASSNRTLFALPLESSDSGITQATLSTNDPVADDNSITNFQREQIVHERVGAGYALLPLLLAGWLTRRRRCQEPIGRLKLKGRLSR